MQMLIMTFRSTMEDRVVKWLKAEGLSFTFMDKAHGKGETGHDLNSVYWGGMNTMLFAGIQDEQFGGFRERMQNWQRELTGESRLRTPVHVFVVPCIQWF